MIAACSCGRVAYELVGRPILSVVCYCADCQAGSERLQAVREPAGGTAYVLYRKDRVRCTRGAELLEKHKLVPSSATSRVVASCCSTPMIMWFDDAKHWTPVYRARVDAPPPVAMRICTRFARVRLAPSDVPAHAGYPLGFVAKLVGARLAMLLGR